MNTIVSDNNKPLLKKVVDPQQLEYAPLKRSEPEIRYLDQYLKPEGNFREVDYLGYVMPGSANEPNHDWCGKWLRKGCVNIAEHKDSKAYLKQFQRSCYVATCPTCAHKWMARLAKQSDERLSHAKKTNRIVLSHVVISVPSWLSHKPLKALRKLAYIQLKKVGVRGGNLMFHAYRHKDVGDQRIWYYSPHFHGIMTGWIHGGLVAKECHQLGWVVVKIRTLFEDDEVFPLMLYLLSHSAIVEGKHSLTWFGNLAYGELKIPKDDSIGKCPECGSSFVSLELTDKCLLPPDEEYSGLVPPDWVFEPKVMTKKSWGR